MVRVCRIRFGSSYDKNWKESEKVCQMKPIMLTAKNMNCLLFLQVTVIMFCLLSPAAAQRHDSQEDETTLVSNASI